MPRGIATVIGAYIRKADAALAASLFHYKELDIMELKKYLADNGIPMRM